MAETVVRQNRVDSMATNRWKWDRQAISSLVEIVKPRISVMVLFTVWAGAVAGGWASEHWLWLHAMLGTALVAASGSAFNQYLERYSDFFMPRTAGRPLPGGRLSATQVVVFGAVTLGAGLAYLAATVHWSSVLWCFATWVCYVWIYTPAKPRTAWNTAIGAFPGAMPVLVGATALNGSITWLSWILFAILYLWQFPHFMAIAWKYRDDYAAGGLKMLTVTDPSGRRAGQLAVATAVVLLLVSLAAGFWLSHQVIYLVLTSVIGGLYLWRSIRFLRDRNDQTARGLLKYSLLHLPIQMCTLLSCL